jgi:hypothetical protein
MSEYIDHGLAFIVGVAFGSLLWGIYYGVAGIPLAGAFLAVVFATCVFLIRKHTEYVRRF